MWPKGVAKLQLFKGSFYVSAAVKTFFFFLSDLDYGTALFPLLLSRQPLSIHDIHLYSFLI